MLPVLSKWRLPIIPGRLQPSTFSVKSLNFRVRYGYGCFPLAIAATFLNNHNSLNKRLLIKFSTYQYSQAQSITTLTLTAYLPCGLQGVLLKGNLILRGASCLDAFSSYPFQTQLLSYATGVTTHKPLVCPSRSSRTKDSSFQISYAHDGQGPNCLATF